MASVRDLKLLTLSRYLDHRGELVPVELPRDVPFHVVRLFWIRDVPGGVTRGTHAHSVCHQYVCCMAGPVMVDVFDGVLERTITLVSGTALHVPPDIHKLPV
jgi:hypothetical protein